MSYFSSVNTFLTVLLFLVTSAFIIGCSTLEGDIANGKRWYRMHNCFACHGENGSDGKGPNIAGLEMSNRSFISRLRNSETTIMPEFNEGKISNQDAADILAFLKNLE